MTPLPQPLDPEALQRLIHDLEGLDVLDGGPALHELSRDQHHLSPPLEEALRGCRAQVVVRAHDREQLRRVAALCHRHRAPLTLRGAGTGNHGQCVPLSGGVVLDTSPLQRLLHLDPATGVLTAEPGCRLLDLDRLLQPQGRALRLSPSTWRTATLGGFIAGGSGGIGSLRWGFLREPGNVLGLEVVTLEPQPRRLRLEGSAARPLNHAYGTNGILTAVRLATAPAVAWQQVVATFGDRSAALEAARQLAASALDLNALALLEAPLGLRMPWPQGCPAASAKEHRLLLFAAPDCLPLLPELLAELGGALLWQEPQGGSRGVPLREITWNHTTLHWRAHHPEWTYLQLMLPEPEEALLAVIDRRWPDAVLWHLEAVRVGGRPRLSGLPLVRLGDAAGLAELIACCRDHGAEVADPHVISVEDGGSGQVDPEQVAAKHAHDPAGLLNPGKLRGWRGI